MKTGSLVGHPECLAEKSEELVAWMRSIHTLDSMAAAQLHANAPRPKKLPKHRADRTSHGTR